MYTSLVWLDVLLGFVSVYLVCRVLTRKSAVPPLPPGPAGLPFVGNIFDVPSSKEWETYTQWGKEYGDMVHVNVMGQPLIIINSSELAKDMMDRKGSIYSDRPIMPMMGEEVGWKYTTALAPYGERLRSHRKLFHKLFGTSASVSQFYAIQDAATRVLLQRILEKPQALHAHIRHAAGAIILKIAYGYQVLEKDDPLIETVDNAIQQFNVGAAPGAFIVNLVPAMRHVPSWVPGITFKNVAARWALTINEIAETPFAFVKQEMANGTAIPSYTSMLIEDQDHGLNFEHDIKWSAASLYIAGGDTTVAAIHAFFLAMALHPESQSMAQAEIDSVVGEERLPSFADRHRLPYLNALVLEVLRWHPVTPQGVPHGVIVDDVHAGYYIPKGSWIVPNVAFMLKDPRVYDEPEMFRPARFIGTSVRPAQRDPREVCFGFGRRICSGMVQAEASIFISCAMSLAVFNITKAVENGRVVEPVHEKMSGTVSRLKDFKCSIQPRSAKAAALVVSDERA